MPKVGSLLASKAMNWSSCDSLIAIAAATVAGDSWAAIVAEDRAAQTVGDHFIDGYSGGFQLPARARSFVS